MTLATIFEQLDQWVMAENKNATVEGIRLLPKSLFRVVGQAALLEAKVEFNVAATVDVDVLNNAKHEVVAKLSELLLAEGLELDPLSNEIWMPLETQYVEIFKGDWVTSLRAETEFIMVSKALKAPAKNRVLLRNYIATRPPVSFFEMCEKYKVNLDTVIEG
ncbi:MAG: hypothetical protein RIQ81_1119 [Pseudomonadota bacterium]|jgi:hypothetical protein